MLAWVAEAHKDYQAIRISRKAEAQEARMRILSLCHPAELLPRQCAWQPLFVPPSMHMHFFKVLATTKAAETVDVYTGTAKFVMGKLWRSRQGCTSISVLSAASNYTCAHMRYPHAHTGVLYQVHRCRLLAPCCCLCGRLGIT